MCPEFVDATVACVDLAKNLSRLPSSALFPSSALLPFVGGRVPLLTLDYREIIGHPYSKLSTGGPVPQGQFPRPSGANTWVANRSALKAGPVGSLGEALLETRRISGL